MLAFLFSDYMLTMRIFPEAISSWDIDQTAWYINGLMQKRRNSIANALELRLFCIKSLICGVSSEIYGIIVWP